MRPLVLKRGERNEANRYKHESENSRGIKETR